MASMTGGCACGRIRYTAETEDDGAYLCHCRMCQRATGNVSIALKTLNRADLVWHTEPDWYASSPIARRPYCRECGTSLGFAYVDSDKIDVTVGSADDPSPFRPKHHFGAESMHRAWIDTKDLPEKRSDDYKPLVERWIRATGSFPG